MLIVAMAKFDDLDRRVARIKTKIPRLVHVIEGSITTNYLQGLVEEGWEVEWDKDLKIHYAVIPKGEKKILLSPSKIRTAYQRDIALFHEIAHIYGGDLLHAYHEEFKEPIAEWFGRKWRADPDLLQCAITSFGLKPYSYDYPSSQAFPEQITQLYFPWCVNKNV